MKNFLFSTVLFLMVAMPATCDEITITLNDVGDGIKHPPQKDPSLNQILPTVLYDEGTNFISFICDSDLGYIPVTITNENDTVVLTDTIYIESGTAAILSVGQLSVGDYTLYISIGDTIYFGMFTK